MRAVPGRCWGSPRRRREHRRVRLRRVRQRPASHRLHHVRVLGLEHLGPQVAEKQRGEGPAHTTQRSITRMPSSGRRGFEKILRTVGASAGLDANIGADFRTVFVEQRRGPPERPGRLRHHEWPPGDGDFAKPCMVRSGPESPVAEVRVRRKLRHVEQWPAEYACRPCRRPDFALRAFAEPLEEVGLQFRHVIRQ